MEAPVVKLEAVPAAPVARAAHLVADPPQEQVMAMALEDPKMARRLVVLGVD